MATFFAYEKNGGEAIGEDCGLAGPPRRFRRDCHAPRRGNAGYAAKAPDFLAVQVAM